MRISVVGCSGSGKSTVASRLAAELGIPHVELDALHWDAGWTEAPADELRARVTRATSGDAWVVDGNYQGKIGRLVWERADTVVWLDPPRWRSMGRCVRRTMRRVVTRQRLWNGNRETWRALLIWRGEDSILWWAWTSYPAVRARYERATTDPANAHLTFLRLGTVREVKNFLGSARG